MEIRGGLAFDDVLLVPKASEVVPLGVEIFSRISKLSQWIILRLFPIWT